MAWNNQFFALAKEPNWGTLAARVEAHEIFGDSFQRLVKDKEESGTLQGVDPSSLDKQQERCEGQARIKPVTRGMKHFMAFLFNIDPTAIVTTGSGPYVHTYKLGDIGPGYSCEQNFDFPDAGFESELGEGNKAQTFEMRFQEGEEPSLQVNYNGETTIQGPPSSGLTLPDYDQFRITACSRVCEIDDVAARATGCVITGDHRTQTISEMDGTCALAEQFRDSGRRNIGGTVDLRWIDRSHHLKFRQDTRFKLAIKAAIGADLFNLVFPSCEFLADPYDFGDGGEVIRGVPFRSMAHADSPMMLELTNGLATGE